MKQIIAFTLFFFASLLVHGQSAVEKFHKKYKDDKDATTITLSGNLFKLIGDIAEHSEDEETEAVARIANGIQSFQLIKIPFYESGLKQEEIKALKASLQKEKYEELMNMRDGREKVNILAQGDEKDVRNMVILVEEKEEFSLININGALSMKDLSYLAKNHKDWK